MKPLHPSVTAEIPIDGLPFQMSVFQSEEDRREHVVVRLGDFPSTHANPTPPICRVHSECLTGDIFGSQKCDCGWQLEQALDRIATEGQGLLIYLRQEGRGLGLVEKLRTYNEQARGLDTVEANHALGYEADLREYSTAIGVLRYYQIHAVRLMTNNPAKIEALEAGGIRCERAPIIPEPIPTNESYLRVKQAKMRHILGFSEGHG